MPSYYDLTVSLQDVLPRSRRRVLLRTTVSFAALHAVIQGAYDQAAVRQRVDR